MASPAAATQRHGMSLILHSPVGIASIVVLVTGIAALGFIAGPGSGLLPALGDEPTPTATAAISATPSSSPDATPPPTRTPVPTPEPVPPWTALTWSDPVTPPFVVHLSDLVPWGDGYVAVGSVEVDATRSEAAFLTSPDGLHWTIAQQQDAGFNRYPMHLVALGSELFAFSNQAAVEDPTVGASRGTYHGPLAWSSTDGERWTRIDSPSWEAAWSDVRVGPMPEGWDPTQYAIETGLVDAAGGPNGIIAIGNSFTDRGLDPILLQSTDGRAWAEVRLSPDSPSALLHAVVTFDGGFVLVGASNVGWQIETAMPAAWFSTHGTNWTRATVERVPAGSEFGRVTAGADGLLAWAGARGMRTGPRFTSPWTSPDGITWSPTETPFSRFDRVAADGTRIVALGPMPDPTTDPALWSGINQGWVSSDGVTWQAVALSSEVDDLDEGLWVVPDGVIYAGVQSFWFGAAQVAD